MANEFKHGTVGTTLTQAEYEAVGGHVVDSQAIGDLVYASSTSQLRKLAIGSTNDILMVKSGIPDWEAQTQITSVGTIATGTWQGTAITSSYINASQTGITSIGTIGTGTWQATDIGVAYGGTGVSTLLTNAVLTGNGASAIQAETTLLFSSNKLIPTASAHNVAGTVLTMSAGPTTAGTTNNIAGGALTFQGGQGKGSGAGGAIIFQTADAGTSGNSLNALAEKMRITDGGNVLIGGDEGGANEYELMVVRDETSDSGQVQIAFTSYSSGNNDTASLYFRKSDDNDIGDLGATDDGEWLGTINWVGVGYYDSNLTFANGAYIQAIQNGALDGTTVSKVPTDLIFATAVTGGTNHAMRLTKDRQLLVGGYDEPIMASSTQSAVEVTNYTANQHPRMVLNAFGTTDSARGYINFTKSASDTIGAIAQTSASESLGNITWSGVNADNAYKYAARIIVSAVALGASGQNIPGSMQFETYSTSGANTAQLFLETTGDIGINKANPAYDLDVVANINYSGSLTNVSDVRTKSNIEPIVNALDKVVRMRGVTFESEHDSHGIGLVAQELETILPEVVVTADDDMKTKSIKYIHLIGYLVESIKELNSKLEEK